MTRVQLLLLLALCGKLTLAQNATVSGLILDPSMLKVAGAEIVVRNEQTGGRRATMSNNAGYYSVLSLNPGVYRISVRVAGFETMIRDGVKLDVGERARLDFTLRIGDSRTEVTIHGGPPLINTENAAVGTVIDRDIIDQMPLNGRGIQSLIELSPGVVVVPVVDSNRGQFAVNGQRSDANYITVDGVAANFSAGNPLSSAGRGPSSPGFTSSIGQAGGGMLPANNVLGTFSNLVSPDALQEFRIETSTFAAEFGRSPGAQVELITRSGTNRYSGTLFEYFRNDKTDANDWFVNLQHGSKPALRFNNFGGTLGGPVWAPHYNGHDRTFFFLSIEDLQMAQPQATANYYVPSLDARRNAPPLVASLLNVYPLPTSSVPGLPDFGRYAGSSSLRTVQQTYGLRIDHTLTNRLLWFARYNRAPSHITEPVASVPMNPEKYAAGTEMLTLGLTHILTANLLNEIRLNGSSQLSELSAQLKAPGGIDNLPDSLLFPTGSLSNNSLVEVLNFLVPVLEVGLINQYKARQLQLRDNLSYSRGAHQFKIGIDYRWFSPVQVEPRSVATLLSSFGLGANNSKFDLVVIASNDPTRAAYAMGETSTFAQDIWKTTDRLTLTYGIRWEVNPAPKVTAGGANIGTGLSNLPDVSTASLVPPGKAFYPTSWSNFAPRLGIAWQIFGSGDKQTVLRTGVGRFFDQAQVGFEGGGIFNRTTTTYSGQALGSIGVGSPRSATTVDFTGRDVTAAVPGYNLPVTYQWNATVEQAIGQQVISAGYIGALGRRLIRSLALPGLAPYTFVNVLDNSASSSYNAMQLQFNRRLSTGLRLLLSYTWAHSIDTLSNDLQGLNATIQSLSQYYNPNVNRGSSDFDVRHSLNGSLIAALPSPRTGHVAVLLRNWSANSIFFARSALPTTILSSDMVTRADLVAGQPLYLYGSVYPGGKSYNKAAFSNPVAGMQGNLGRNILRGFGAWQVDFALHRTFRLSEHAAVQLRAEAFNVLNHPNFANPSDPSAPGQLSLSRPPPFGTSNAMLANGLGPQGVLGQLNPLFQIGGPRSLQFALRLAY